MSFSLPDNVTDLPDWRDMAPVFEDRADAGRKLAEMLEGELSDRAKVLAIPAGGVPVAAELADRLGLAMDVAVVSKITLPWNTEAGCGAVTFDGSVRINESLVRQVGLGQAELDRQVDRTRDKVRRREKRFRGRLGPALEAGDEAILVDDGLASGFTMMLAVEAVRGLRPSTVRIAVPTGHLHSVRGVSELCDHLICANVRAGYSFAVASAYQHWHDVSEDEAMRLFRHARSR